MQSQVYMWFNLFNQLLSTCLTGEACRHHTELARLMQGTSTGYCEVKSPLFVSVSEEGKGLKSWLDLNMCWCFSTPTKFQQQINQMSTRVSKIICVCFHYVIPGFFPLSQLSRIVLITFALIFVGSLNCPLPLAWPCLKMHLLQIK